MSTCFADSRESLAAMIATLERFSRYSGLCLNYDKSAILPIGHQQLLRSPPGGLRVMTRVKILRIWVSRDRTEQDHYQWKYLPILQSMRTTCATWANRTLSLKGRVTVFNSLIYSKLQYVNANTVTPQGVHKEVRGLASKFLWARRKSKGCIQHGDSVHFRGWPWIDGLGTENTG